MGKKILKSYLNLATLLFLPKVPHPIILIIIIYIYHAKRRMLFYLKFDIFDSYSLVMRIISINVLLAIVALHNLKVL